VTFTNLRAPRRAAPPGKAEVIHAAADLLTGLVTTRD